MFALNLLVASLKPLAIKLAGAEWALPLSAFCHYFTGNGKTWELPQEGVEELKELVSKRLALHGSLPKEDETLHLVVEHQHYSRKQLRSEEQSFLANMSPLQLTIGGFSVYVKRNGNRLDVRMEDQYDWHNCHFGNDTPVPQRLTPLVEKIPAFVRDKVGIYHREAVGASKAGWCFNEEKLNQVGNSFLTWKEFSINL